MTAAGLFALHVVGHVSTPQGTRGYRRLPQALQPVFAVAPGGNGTTIAWVGSVFMPPYTLRDQRVEGEIRSGEEFAQAVSRREMEAIPPVAARPGHVLWTDSDGQLHYEPDVLAWRHLEEIRSRHMAASTDAFSRRLYEEARIHALLAVSAVPSDLSSLVALAAAFFKLGEISLFHETMTAARRLTGIDLENLLGRVALYAEDARL